MEYETLLYEQADHVVTLTYKRKVDVFKPVIVFNVLNSIRLLGDATASFSEHCVEGIEPVRARIAELLAQSLMLVTALNPHIGYEKAAQISLLAYREDMSLRDAALRLGYLSGEQFDQWVKPADMTHPLVA